MKHSDYVKIAQGLGASVLRKSIVGGVVKAIPFLASGPFSPILVKFAEWLVEAIMEQGEMAVFFKYIDMRADLQARDFEAAMIQNHKIQLTGTVQEKKESEERLQIALEKLISLKR